MEKLSRNPGNHCPMHFCLSLTLLLAAATAYAVATAAAASSCSLLWKHCSEILAPVKKRGTIKKQRKTLISSRHVKGSITKKLIPKLKWSKKRFFFSYFLIGSKT